MTLDERIEQLMQTGCDYDPLRADNLAESLSNLKIEQVEKIARWLRDAMSLRLDLAYTLTGQSLAIFAYEQWKELATTQAQADEEREQDEACPKCNNIGTGCPECDEDYRREQREARE